MSNSNTIAYVDNQTLVNIANAVRTKTGTNGKMLLSDIPDKIRNIEGIVPIGTQTITENGVYDVTEKAEVDVDVQPDLRPLSVSENGSYQPDGFDGYSGVEVSIPTVEKVLINEAVLTENKIADNITERFWIENYIPSDQNFIGVYVITFENNNAPRYGAVKILTLGRFYQNKRPLCVLWRLENGVAEKYDIDNNSSRSCTASIGTVIKTYKLQYDGEI